MKLTLTNFRCYEKQTFDIGKGLVLLSGPSGVGKSTICIAINFVLFGVGNKVVSQGKNSCNVELEFDNVKIQRSKRPNRLIYIDEYNNHHEDDSAQSIINDKFGEMFGVTGYISQNALNSFIVLSPVEKLEFFEKFAFQDTKLDLIKERNRQETKSRYELMLKTIAQLETTKELFEQMKLPDKVTFPIKCSNANQPIAEKNEHVRLKKTINQINNINRELQKLRDENHAVDILNANILFNQTQIEKNNIELQTQTMALNEHISNFVGDKELLNINKFLQQISLKRDLYKFEEQYREETRKINEMRKQETQELHDQLLQLKSTIWTDYSASETDELLHDYEDTIQKLNQLCTLRQKLNLFINDKNEDDIKFDEDIISQRKQELESLKVKQHDYELSKELLICPRCNVHLQLDNKKLIETHIAIDNFKECDEIDTKISQLSSVIKQKESDISKFSLRLKQKNEILQNIKNIESEFDEVPQLKDVKQDYEYMLSYRTKQIQDEKQKKIIEHKLSSNLFSTTLVNVLKNQDALHSKIKILRESCTDDDLISNKSENEETLRTKSKEQERIKSEISFLRKSINKLKTEIDQCEQSIVQYKQTHSEVFKEIRTNQSIKHSISQLETSISELNKKRNEHENNLKRIDDYKEYIKQLSNYNDWKIKYEKLIRDKYAASTLLKEKILEAESIALTNIISSVNLHAQMYLDCFFVENPIVVQLQTFKETKKNNKPQINILIQYKDMECDLYMLSGGELSRIILAFTLALSEIFNTPLLLLDECTASLNQDLTELVFNTIRDNYKGKLVLVIAHQIVTGIFDKTIQL